MYNEFLGGLSGMFGGQGGGSMSTNLGGFGMDAMSRMAGMKNMPHGQDGPVSRSPTPPNSAESPMLGGLSTGLQNMGNRIQDGFGEFAQSPFGQAIGTGYEAMGQARNAIGSNPIFQALSQGAQAGNDLARMNRDNYGDRTQRYGISGTPDDSQFGTNEELEELIQMLRARMQQQ